MFIVFEGLESSGKSTQIKRLGDFLAAQGHAVEVVAEPGTTDLGRGVRQLVMHQQIPIVPLSELLLYEAARAQLTAERIRPALAAGGIVLADRYTLSSLAYQGYGRGLDIERVCALDGWATGGLVPDLTLFFDIPIEEMRRRQGPSHRPDRLEQEDAAFFQRVRDGYLRELEGHPHTHLLNGQLAPDALFQQVKRLALDLLDGP